MTISMALALLLLARTQRVSHSGRGGRLWVVQDAGVDALDHHLILHRRLWNAHDEHLEVVRVSDVVLGLQQPNRDRSEIDGRGMYSVYDARVSTPPGVSPLQTRRAAPLQRPRLPCVTEFGHTIKADLAAIRKKQGKKNMHGARALAYVNTVVSSASASFGSCCCGAAAGEGAAAASADSPGTELS